MRLSNEKASKIRSGQTLYRVWVQVNTNRFVQPHQKTIKAFSEVICPNGKRKHNDGEFGHRLNGTYGGYFTKKKQADKFCQEIIDGLHPHILSASEEWEDYFDMMDELSGICDRGMGGFVEPGIDEDAHDDHEFI